MRPEREAAGYDREAYEYEIELQRQPETFGLPGVAGSRPSSGNAFILKFEGPLSTPAKVQEAAGLTTLPIITKGTDADKETREASFCHIDDSARQNIIAWLLRENIVGFRPTIVRVSKADTELSSVSMHPTLGIESTLPQYRASNPGTVFTPTEDQYPVWYFFYGSSVDADVLSSRLSLFSMPVFRSTSITGGVVRSWGGKYRALVDSHATIPINGWAFQVVSREYEDALRLYETEAYEVVRCSITMKDKPDEVVNDLVFRFAGPREYSV